MRRIAFFGGSFDPPHRGHLAVAKVAADHFALDQVLFAPVAIQPFKDKLSVTPFFHRYAMTTLACQADLRFFPSLLDAPADEHSPDLPNSTPNYTIDTLKKLRARLPVSSQHRLFTLLGADSWLQIARWHCAAELLGLTDWIVASRPGFSLAQAGQALPAQMIAEQIRESGEDVLLLRHPGNRETRVFFLPFLQEDISATGLRVELEQSRAQVDLPPSVEDYIMKTGLYGRSAQGKLADSEPAGSRRQRVP